MSDTGGNCFVDLFFVCFADCVYCVVRWLFEGVGRQKAEELLLLPGNRVGSFLVRESTTERGKNMYIQYT